MEQPEKKQFRQTLPDLQCFWKAYERQNLLIKKPGLQSMKYYENTVLTNASNEPWASKSSRFSKKFKYGHFGRNAQSSELQSTCQLSLQALNTPWTGNEQLFFQHSFLPSFPAPCLLRSWRNRDATATSLSVPGLRPRRAEIFLSAAKHTKGWLLGGSGI